MKKILLSGILICFFKLAFSQKANVTTVLNFTGLLGTYPIEMRLEFSNKNDSISGSYYYAKSGFDNKIYLQGILKEGNLQLTENTYNPNKITGYFKLSYQNGLIQGSWQKNINAPVDKILAVNLNCNENLLPFNLANYNFLLNTKPHKHKYTEDYTQIYAQLLSLQIQQNGTNKWLLKGFNEGALMSRNEIILEDLNFDGLLDVKIPIDFPGRIKNDSGFLYFIYNNNSKSFIQNQELNELEYVECNAAKKEVLKYDADGNGNEGTSYFKWQKNKLYLSKEIRVYENDAYIHYTEYILQGGKIVVAKRYKKKA